MTPLELIEHAVAAIGQHELRTEEDSLFLAEAVGYLIEARTALRNEASFVDHLRLLQHTANMLSYPEFCAATGWERDDYSKAKFVEFQKLGRLHRFDDHTLTVTVSYYLGRKLGEDTAKAQL